VNLILLTGVILVGTTPRAAYAQSAGLANNYVLVTGQIQHEFDAIYLIDVRERTLHVFYFNKGSRELEWAGYRDLERDFRNNSNDNQNQ
jgi:hypothetical protein